MKLFSPSIALLIAITVFAPLASGQTPLYYQGGITLNSQAEDPTGPGDENFNTAANWSTVPPNTYLTGGTNQVPNSSNIAVIQADLNSGNVFYTEAEGAFINTNTPTPVVVNQTQTSNTVAGFIVSNFGFVGLGSGNVTFNNVPSLTFTVQGTNAAGGDFVVDGGVTFNYAGGGAFKVSEGTIIIGDDENFTQTTNNTVGGPGTFNIQAGSFNFDTTTANATKMIVGGSQSGFNDQFFSNTTGAVTQGSDTLGTSSSVVTGTTLVIGSNSGTGTWKLTNASSFQTGFSGSSYLIALGSNGASGGLTGIGSQGTFTVSDTSSATFGYVGSTAPTDVQLGTTVAGAVVGLGGGTGTIIQNGVGSHVNFDGTLTTVEVGDLQGGTGNYQLSNGTLNIGANAGDAVTFTLGATLGSTGTLTQSGGSIVVGTGSTFTMGVVGTGVYTISGASSTALFTNGLTFGSRGTINLNGGQISSPIALFSGSGTLNLGGGTLKLTGAAGAANYAYNFAGSLTQNTSTIDVSSATGLTTFTFNNPLTGAGGINLVGNGTTVFNFASFAGGTAAANTYSGSTGISGGTLNALAEDLSGATAGTALIFGSSGAPGTLNLTLDSNVSPITTLNQAITGTGQLNVIFSAAGETLKLANTTSSLSSVGIAIGATGGNAGTLQVLNGAFGTITDNGTGSNVVVGLSGGAGAGSVVFGATNYSGLTTINPSYSLSAPNLQGSVVNNGGLSVSTNIGHAGGANTVINTGSLSAGSIVGDVTSNSGTMVITGPGITGNVISNSGSLSTANVSGSVTSTGTFVGSSALGATTVGGNLTSSGSLSSTTALPTVAAPPTQATFTIGGNLVESGNINIRTNGIAADEYAIGGTASVGGTAHLSGFGTNSTGYTVVSSTGALTDNGLTLTSTTLFSGTLTQVGNTLVLTTVQLPSANFSLTPAQRNVAMAIDKFLINPLSLSGYSTQVQNQFLAFNNIYSNLTAGQFPLVQEQLTPITLQYARDIAFENTTYLAERMNGVDANLRGGYEGLDTSAVSIVSPGFGSGLGRSLGSLMASNDDPGFHSSAPNGVNYYPGESGRSSPSPSASEPAEAPAFDSSNQVISDTPNPYLANVHPGGPDTPKLSEFIGGDVVLADLNKDGTLANAPSSSGNYTAGGATAGVSFRVSNHFAAGVLFDYNHTDATTDSNGSKIKVDSYSPGLFATFFDKGFYANGLLSFGYNNYTDTRALPAFGTTASSSPSGQQYVGDLDVGYDFHPDKAWVVGPTLGATYTHLDIDSVQETGAGFEDLSINSQSLDSLRSRLGGHVLYQTYTGDVLLQPTFTAMWQHEFLASASDLNSNFTELGGASSFTTPTASPVRNSALIGLGLTATLSNSMALYLSYLADVGDSDFFSQSVIGGFKARF